MGHIQRNPADTIRLGTQQPARVERRLTKPEIRKLITASKTFTKKGKSHYMMVSLGIYR